MIIVKKSSSVKADVVGIAKNTTIQWLIDGNDGAQNFFMRLFTVEPEGHSPSHSHDWEHEVFILKGEGKMVTAEKEIPFEARDVVFVPSNEQHQFVNTGDTTLEFLCMIPKK